MKDQIRETIHKKAMEDYQKWIKIKKLLMIELGTEKLIDRDFNLLLHAFDSLVEDTEIF